MLFYASYVFNTHNISSCKVLLHVMDTTGIILDLCVSVHVCVRDIMAFKVRRLWTTAPMSFIFMHETACLS